MKRIRRISVLLAAGCACLGFTGCSGPVTTLFVPTHQEQVKLGAKAAAEENKKATIVTGSPSERVKTVGTRLVAALPPERQKWSYSFQVVQDKDYNAFALPGGPIYVNTGLLDRVQTDDELAAVVGHEMTHVWDQHWAKQYAAATEKEVGITVLISATKSNQSTADVASILGSLTNLSYSRKEEDAADKGGLQTMVAAGYDPQGMVRMFETMQTVAKSGGTPEFLRSHPDTKDRIKKTQERIAKMNQK
jgi:beta-barrel assembly-enhancing protease